MTLTLSSTSTTFMSQLVPVGYLKIRSIGVIEVGNTLHISSDNTITEIHQFNDDESKFKPEQRWKVYECYRYSGDDNYFYLKCKNDKKEEINLKFHREQIY